MMKVRLRSEANRSFIRELDSRGIHTARLDVRGVGRESRWRKERRVLAVCEVHVAVEA
jgi:alpha-beta hydrolase superfamily lysophospholipase